MATPEILEGNRKEIIKKLLEESISVIEKDFQTSKQKIKDDLDRYKQKTLNRI